MHFRIVSAQPPPRRAAGRQPCAFTDVTWIFGEAIHDCRGLLHLRQQTATIASVELHSVAPLQERPTARLLALAIDDISGVSCRGGDLSLAAVGNAVIIQSRHPLDIAQDMLSIDGALREAASELGVVVAMAWDQGRGPRLTLSMPRAGDFGEGRRRA